jgi:hypothetical protein
VDSNARIYANDFAFAGQCDGAPQDTLAGAVARSQVRTQGGGRIVGTPQGITLGNFRNIVDSVQTYWEIFTDPDYEVDYEDSWPSFISLPSDSFPVIRWNNNFTANWSRNGRGVLIIDGQLRIPNWAFWSWYGIVMANDIQDNGNRDYFYIYGMLLGGMGEEMPNDRYDLDRGYIYYHSCYVKWAGMSLAHFEPLINSWWEET